MRHPAAASVIVLTAALCVPIGVPAASRSDWQCTAKPIEPCAKRHGRLSSQNGIGLKIWLIGIDAGQTSPQLEKEAVDRAKSVIVRSLDGTLPDRTLETWLRDLFGSGAKTTWEVNDCGEQTGDPQRDRGRDFPMCVDVSVSLTDNRVLHVLLAVGTVQDWRPAGDADLFLRRRAPGRNADSLAEGARRSDRHLAVG